MIEAKIAWLFAVQDPRTPKLMLTVGLVTQGAVKFRVEIRDAQGNSYYSLHRLSPCHDLPTFTVRRKSGFEAQQCPDVKCGRAYGAVKRTVGLTVREGLTPPVSHTDLLREQFEDWHDALGSDVLTASLQASELVNLLYGLPTQPRPANLRLLKGNVDDEVASICQRQAKAPTP